MTERPTPLTEALDDAELQTLYGDAAVMFDAERELEGAVADLVQAPFDTRVQQTLANYLSSEQLQRATEAARRIGGQG
ncbi:hypothetical protein [Micrococcus luteus]|uniref:hypothetical protein n=1 Tax=Micrococcus luteus TaxID=1270 RepID=UPI003634E29C